MEKEKSTIIQDGFNNLAGYISNREKSIINQFQTKNILNNDNIRYFQETQTPASKLGFLYFNSAWVNRCINIIVNDIYKYGFNISFANDKYKDKQEEFEKFFERTYLNEVKKATCDALVYGGGLLMKSDITQSPKEQYTLSIKTDLYHIPYIMYSTLPAYIPNTFIFNGVNKWIVGSKSIAKSNIEKVQGYGEVSKFGSGLDKSFGIGYSGLNIPYEYQSHYKYQGGSFIAPNIDNVIADITILENVANLVYRNGVLIYNVKDLTDKLGKSQEEAKNFMDNLKLVNMGINSTGIFLTDGDNEVKPLGASLSDLSTLLNDTLTRLCGYFGLSLTKVIGKSPDGMNATGTSDIYHDIETIMLWQEHFYNQTKEVLEIALIKYFGEEIKFDFDFNKPEYKSDLEVAKYEEQLLKNAELISTSVESEPSLNYLYKNGLIDGKDYKKYQVLLAEFKEDLENDENIYRGKNSPTDRKSVQEKTS